MLKTEQIANQVYNDPRTAAEVAGRLVALAECSEAMQQTKWWQIFKRMALHNRMAQEAGKLSKLLLQSQKQKER